MTAGHRRGKERERRREREGEVERLGVVSWKGLVDVNDDDGGDDDDVLIWCGWLDLCGGEGIGERKWTDDG